VQFVRDPSSDEIFTSPLSYGVAAFSVDLEARRDAITLATPAQVKPGETVAFKVGVAHPARVAVFAVDEGILQVARYQAADPLGHFFQKRALEVRTSQILDLLLPEFSRLAALSAPGGDADGGLGKHLNPFKRKSEAPAVWWSGIMEIDGTDIVKRMGEGQVAVISGFQGLGPDNRIATLGRGGSDTSAVAIAAAVKADRCDIYTDVDGVYTTDPRIVPKARRLKKIAFEEMLEMASLGAKVLQVRSVELAMVHKVRTFVRSSFEDPDAPGMGDLLNPPGTLICDEDEIVEQEVVTGIAYAKDEAQISLRRLADRPGVSAAIFGPLAESHINVDMIVQNISEDGSKTDMTFTVPSGDVEKAIKVLGDHKEKIGYDVVQNESGLVKVSVIGIGMRSHAGVAAKAFKALSEKQINIRAITTSEIKFSILIDAAYTELAVRTLHSLYGLDK
jgi:aspartate kinase